MRTASSPEIKPWACGLPAFLGVGAKPSSCEYPTCSRGGDRQQQLGMQGARESLPPEQRESAE